MKKSQRKPSSADVARSLQQLNWLFGKRSAENERALREQSADAALLTGKLKAEELR